MARYRPEGLQDAFAETDRTSAAQTETVPPADATAAPSEPLAPSAPVAVPAIGFVGWLRWAWRQLTSMRVALLLLMLLAVAAVPGAVLPQRAQDPAKVATYLSNHPTSGPWLDRLQMFNVYSSFWFSAIYLLLFVSLVGCILPRTKVHLGGVRGRPPRTPRRLDRFPAQGGGTSTEPPEQVATAAAAHLRRGWAWLPFVRTYRVDVHDEGAGTWSVSAERGYLRETGNLLFHLALVGLLVSIASGQMLHYRGQAIVVQGHGFANAVTEYDTFEQGTLFRASTLVPFTLSLDGLDSRFDSTTLEARDFTAHVTLTNPGARPEQKTIKVNHPLDAGGAHVYLQGNGYAPQIDVTDASGKLAFSGSVPFLPQDNVYTSKGVVKVPDVSGTQDQVGLVGFLLPTAQKLPIGAYRSIDPQPKDPLLVLSVWHGNLGLDTGVPQNVYELDEARMKQSVDASGQPVTLYLKPGQTVQLPDGLGAVTFHGLDRYAALDLRHDPTLGWVLVFAICALAGLAASLFAPRRRLFVRAVPGADGGPTVVTAAGLARGDDVGLQGELDRTLEAVLGQGPAAGPPPAAPPAAGRQTPQPAARPAPARAPRPVARPGARTAARRDGRPDAAPDARPRPGERT
ncbi:cytochrome c biogenesis protein ResB [Cellulomonas alba]|uniref:Cytochrome c biogenesis protein ResB n=1 Tax=Cellulomonas alba TaxID=3053467 RepID=A0ABT7SE26_9CELL|nr:cytochrome c biogenesis protein ResB [Cellulomonas alba]MDM7854418.1 cytochrome c biogenesis protein ResB [Cellulomonas alba]